MTENKARADGTLSIEKKTIYLQEFAIFQSLGRAFLMHVQSHRIQPISQEEYAFLSPLAGQWQAEVGVGECERLLALGLLSLVALSDAKVLAKDTRLSRALIEATPITNFVLHVAQCCNMACTYCYAHGGDFHNPGMMTVETARACIDFMMAYVPADKRLVVSLMGGEPLMNFPVVRECIRYGEEKWPGRIVFRVVTNLTLLDEEMLAFLEAHHVEVTVSMDGPPEYQRRNRPLRNGGDSYAAVVDKIAMARGRLKMSGSATQYAGDDRGAVDRELEALGFSTRAVRIVRNSSHGRQGLDDFAQRLIEDAAWIDRQGRTILSAIARRDAAAVREVLDDPFHGQWFRFCLTTPASTDRKHITFCAAAREEVGISTDGDIYPCAQFNEMKDYRLGSVYTGFSRGDFGLHGAIHNPKCHRCYARYACEGFCMNQAVSLAPPDCDCPPAFYIPPEHCALQKVRLGIHACLASLDGDAAQWLREDVLTNNE